MLDVKPLLLNKRNSAHAQDEVNGGCNGKYFVSLPLDSVHVVLTTAAARKLCLAESRRKSNMQEWLMTL